MAVWQESRPDPKMFDLLGLYNQLANVLYLESAIFPEATLAITREVKRLINDFMLGSEQFRSLERELMGDCETQKQTTQIHATKKEARFSCRPLLFLIRRNPVYAYAAFFSA